MCSCHMKAEAHTAAQTGSFHAMESFIRFFAKFLQKKGKVSKLKLNVCVFLLGETDAVILIIIIIRCLIIFPDGEIFTFRAGKMSSCCDDFRSQPLCVGFTTSAGRDSESRCSMITFSISIHL